MYDENMEERDSVFHERIDKLNDEGYRGFEVKEMNQKIESVELVVNDAEGRTLSATGDTPEEAFKKMIDRIDSYWDD